MPEPTSTAPTTPQAPSQVPATPAGAQKSGPEAVPGQRTSAPVAGTSAAPKGPEQNGKQPEVKDATPAEQADDPTRPFKVKVNGKEYRLTQEEAVAFAQKGMGADQKFQEAHKMRLQAQEFVRLLRSDPLAILTNPKIGLDFKKIAQEYLLEEIKKEQMTPDQRELHEARERLRQTEEERKTSEAKIEQERMQSLVQHHSQTYEKDIVDTLSTAGLPKTRGTVRRMAYYMELGLRQGVELKATDVVDFVKKDYHQDISDLFGALDGDTISQIMGESAVKKIREAELKKLKASQPPAGTPPPVASNGAGSNGQSQKLSKDEWRKRLDAKVGI